jgi:hypothetical protein
MDWRDMHLFVLTVLVIPIFGCGTVRTETLQDCVRFLLSWVEYHFLCQVVH